ncbi:mdtL [Symbiodinium natans]|uniref:MdtL protein n=1 Tax=Symbiodinium natans TaxID=878477 RepID=A0A812QWH0_9DINO|nr:mdtL [Symbiodinium natans]
MADTCDFPSFLQIQTEVIHEVIDVFPLKSQLGEWLTKYVVCSVYACLILIVICLWLFGLPEKAPQHATVQKSYPYGCVAFLGVVYTLSFFTIDQYVPSFPQMEKDLSGTQTLMSLTVQMNFIVKAVFGLLTAGLSDRIGRRPILIMSMIVLCFGSLGCACSQRIEWFVASRILQGIGESVEPVLFAVVRDHIADPDDRYSVISVMHTMSILGMLVAPTFGAWLAGLFNWRISFFGLAVTWAFMAVYAWAAIVESCPDIPDEAVDERDYFQDLSRILNFRALSLLLTLSSLTGAILTFESNTSYITQGNFDVSMMASALVMFAYGGFLIMGLLVKRFFFSSTSVLLTCKTSLTLLACAGIASVLLGCFYSQFLWAYLAGSFLQSSVVNVAVIALNVLFLEPLGDCAGVAASFQTFSMGVLPSLLSMVSTQLLINGGLKFFIAFQASTCLAAGLFFWLGHLMSTESTCKSCESSE